MPWAPDIIAIFPQKRHSADVKRAVDGYLPRGDDKIRQAQLLTEVVNKADITLHRPKRWSNANSAWLQHS